MLKISTILYDFYLIKHI